MKKIFPKIFAVFAVLVLVFALAVPCFADGANSQDIQDAFVNSIPYTMRCKALDTLVESNTEKIFDYTYLTAGRFSVGTNSTNIIVNSGMSGTFLYCDVVLAVDDAVVEEVGVDFIVFNDSMLILTIDQETIDIGLFSADMSVRYFGLNYSIGMDSLVDASGYSVTLNEILVFEGFPGGDVGSFPAEVGSYFSMAIGALDGNERFANEINKILFGHQESIDPKSFYNGYYADDNGYDVPPARKGLFGQVYYLLRNAVYDDAVILDAAQDFTLTQIATILTYCVVLLPFILVMFFVIRFFR